MINSLKLEANEFFLSFIDLNINVSFAETIYRLMLIFK